MAAEPRGQPGAGRRARGEAEHAAVPGPDDCLGRRAGSEGRRADSRSRQSGARTASRSGENLDRQGRRLREGGEMSRRLPLAIVRRRSWPRCWSAGAPRRRRRASSSEKSSPPRGRCSAISRGPSPRPWILSSVPDCPKRAFTWRCMKGSPSTTRRRRSRFPRLPSAGTSTPILRSSCFTFVRTRAGRMAIRSPPTTSSTASAARLAPAFASRNAYMAYYILYAQGFNEGGVFVRDPATGRLRARQGRVGGVRMAPRPPRRRSGATEGHRREPQASLGRRREGVRARPGRRPRRRRRSTTTRCGSR